MIKYNGMFILKFSNDGNLLPICLHISNTRYCQICGQLADPNRQCYKNAKLKPESGKFRAGHPRPNL